MLLAWLIWELWKSFVRLHYLTNQKWTLLEIKMSRMIAKPPQAMEQVFAGMHGASGAGNLIDQYWKGMLVAWFSLEVASTGGEVKFFIRTPSFFKNMVSALMYSQYPQIEINEVADYVNDMPAKLPDDDWNLYGGEYTFTKEDPYPIRTYKEFVIEDIQYETNKVDPLATFLEVMGSIKKEERIWFQILIRPAKDDWKIKGEELVHKLIGKEVKKKKSGMESLFEMLSEMVTGTAEQIGDMVINTGVEPKKDEKPKKEEKEKSVESLMQHLSPGKKDVVAAIEKKMAKLGFQTGIRFVYLAKNDAYSYANVAAMTGSMKQFNTQNLNGFKMANSVTVDYVMKQRREFTKKRRMFDYYKARAFFYPPYVGKPIIMNIEELATVYHFPGEVAETPAMARIESKKSSPPAGLPVG